ncbi:MAG: hypothetical protein ACFE9I_05300 [Candidatus Hermodarchaeota archaeon]
MNLKKILKKFFSKTREFFSDEFGGNLVEYALLIGFALFIFFIIIGVVSSMLDWTVGLSNDFLQVFK